MEILALTGLRALLALWVVAYHFLPEDEAPVISVGHVAVDVFFVLSGYVLTKRYLHEPPQRKDFWLRRFARLYPLYLLSLALGIAAVWPWNVPTLLSPMGQLRTVLQLLLLNAWSHISMFAPNWAAWSLSVEAFFYLLFPSLLVALRHRSQRTLVWTFALASLSCWLAPTAYELLDPDGLGRPLTRADQVLWSWYLKFFPLQRVPEFVAGICCALLPLGRPKIMLATALGASIAACATLPNAFLFCGVLTPAIGLLITSLDTLRPRWLEARPLVALGHASYAMYILHVPWWYTLRRLLAVEEQLDAAQFALYLGSLVLLSLAAHRCIEEPLRKRITRERSGLGQVLGGTVKVTVGQGE